MLPLGRTLSVLESLQKMSNEMAWNTMLTYEAW